MIWDVDIKPVPGVTTKIYVAEILGTHPQYIYKRKFLHCTTHHYYGYTRYSCTTKDTGVYEANVSYYDIKSGNLLKREREWFVLFEGDYYEIDCTEVLYVLFNLRAQGVIPTDVA